MKNLIYVNLLSIFLLLNACSGGLHQSIHQASISTEESYEVKKMVSCCGCYAYYVNFYNLQVLKKQFIVEMGCNFKLPTKHYFEHNQEGKPKIAESFIAVNDDNYNLEVNPLEQEIFKKLDSLYQTESRNGVSRKIILEEIKGYRKAGENEAHFAILGKLKSTRKINSWNE